MKSLEVLQFKNRLDELKSLLEDKGSHDLTLKERERLLESSREIQTETRLIRRIKLARKIIADCVDHFWADPYVQYRAKHDKLVSETREETVQKVKIILENILNTLDHSSIIQDLKDPELLREIMRGFQKIILCLAGKVQMGIETLEEMEVSIDDEGDTRIPHSNRMQKSRGATVHDAQRRRASARIH